jgi:hypothetical protein
LTRKISSMRLMSNLISLRVWLSIVIRFGITPCLLREQQ